MLRVHNKKNSKLNEILIYSLLIWEFGTDRGLKLFLTKSWSITQWARNITLCPINSLLIKESQRGHEGLINTNFLILTKKIIIITVTVLLLKPQGSCVQVFYFNKTVCKFYFRYSGVKNSLMHFELLGLLDLGF